MEDGSSLHASTLEATSEEERTLTRTFAMRRLETPRRATSDGARPPDAAAGTCARAATGRVCRRCAVLAMAAG
jgi:hypothetical protein